MTTYEQMFPGLTLFSDLNWKVVAEEYESNYSDMTFPEYLQQKSIEGDCPPYLFELAYYELAFFELKNAHDLSVPDKRGLLLNPTAHFLSLEFDIKQMTENASKGNIEIIERPHVLCIFKNHSNGAICVHELHEDELTLLSEFEEPKENFQIENDPKKSQIHHFIENGLILNSI